MPISESACGLRNSMHHPGNAGIDEIRSSMLKPRNPQCYAGLNRTRLGHQRGVHAMTNLLEEAINSNDGDHAAGIGGGTICTSYLKLSSSTSSLVVR